MNTSKVTTFDVFKIYWIFVKKYLGYGLITIIGLFLGTLTQSVFVPTFYKKFFDALQSSTDTNATVIILLAVIISIAILNFIGWFSNRCAKFSLQKFEISIMRDVRQYAYDYVLGHSYNFFSNNFTGSLVQRINRFTRAFERIADRFFMDIIPLTVKVVGAGIVLSFVDKKIAFGIFIWVTVFLTISFIFNRIKLKYDIQAAATDSKVSATLSDSISNHSAIQLFTGVDNESKRF